jgi:hypothetical protein
MFVETKELFYNLDPGTLWYEGEAESGYALPLSL